VQFAFDDVHKSRYPMRLTNYYDIQVQSGIIATLSHFFNTLLLLVIN